MLDSIRKKRNVFYSIVLALAIFAMLSIYTAIRTVNCSVLHGDIADAILQHNELETFHLEDWGGVDMTVELSYFWVDTNSMRWDLRDTSGVARIKCGDALQFARYEIRHTKELQRREETGEVEKNPNKWPKVDVVDLPKFMSLFYKGFLDKDYTNVDWLYVSIKSVTLQTESGVEVTTGIEGVKLCNPYHADSWYMRKFK